jgi:L-lactate dehydrogenase (cytochrome)
MKAASALDYRELARQRLPHFLFEYIDGGSCDQITLRRNIEDLQHVQLRQRVLRDISQLDLSTNLFGQACAMPVGFAPVGLTGLYARRGEVTGARVAATAGIPFCLSTMSVCSIEEVRRDSDAPFWFQLYAIKDRGFTRELLARAKAAGSQALVFTVDLPTPGARYRDQRSGLSGASAAGWRGPLRRALQIAARPRWAWDVGLMGRPHTLGTLAPVLEGSGRTGLEDFLGWIRDNFDPGQTWRDLETLRKEWAGPLIVKGILDADDAREAWRCGVDGIVVSNHGGRQLDGVPSTVQALPPIVDAVGSDLTVLADSGIRSGLDVVRMLALGARGVLLGRAWVYALGGGGEAGVQHLVQLIEAEMRVAMALTGARCIADLGRGSMV